MPEVRVPKLNGNDDTYVLLAWLVTDGAPITAGTSIAEIETSKTIDEITADADGLLRHLVPAGTDILPGQLIATVGNHLSPAASSVASQDPTPARQTITAPARARMTALGVTDEQVHKLDLVIVRSADVDSLASGIDGPPPGARHDLPKQQRSVGRTVARSHATIPSAYAAVKADVGSALLKARELVREARRPVGLAELVIAAVASLHHDFPLFFAQLADDGCSVLLADAPHVGVTIDVGAGLFVPVVRDAANQPIAAIARRLMEFRLAAAEGRFRTAELDGANITVTLHADTDVTLAIPLVFPGQACALAVTTPQPEVWLDDENQPRARTICQLGLAYDHRIINGREAALFLRALKEAVA